MLRGQIIGTVPSPPRPLDGSTDLLLTVDVGGMPFTVTVPPDLARAAHLTPDAAVLVDLNATAGRMHAQHIEVLGHAPPHNAFHLTGTCTQDTPDGPVWLHVPALGDVKLRGAHGHAPLRPQGVHALGELRPDPDGWTFHARRVETVPTPGRA